MDINDMPQILTEEEAERKIAMIKAAGEVSEAVNEMKVKLEGLGWNMAEQAALTLFNTLLMTAFSEQMKHREDEREKAEKDYKKRFIREVISLANERGFTQDDITETCVTMIIDNKPEAQVAAVWEDYYGEGTKGVLFSIVHRVNRELADELEQKEENR